MDKKTEKKELTLKQKEDNFLDYLGLDVTTYRMTART